MVLGLSLPPHIGHCICIALLAFWASRQNRTGRKITPRKYKRRCSKQTEQPLEILHESKPFGGFGLANGPASFCILYLRKTAVRFSFQAFFILQEGRASLWAAGEEASSGQGGIGCFDNWSRFRSWLQSCCGNLFRAMLLRNESLTPSSCLLQPGRSAAQRVPELLRWRQQLGVLSSPTQNLTPAFSLSSSC